MEVFVLTLGSKPAVLASFCLRRFFVFYLSELASVMLYFEVHFFPTQLANERAHFGGTFVAEYWQFNAKVI